MEKRGKIATIFLIVGIVGFGYSQYASALEIEVSIRQSELLEENNLNSKYNLQLELDNPSLLYLTAGETDFVISADGKIIGDGTLSPFTLPSLTKTTVDGTFQTNQKLESKNTPTIRISGVTQYDLILTSIDVPFVLYASDEQAREFIH